MSPRAEVAEDFIRPRPGVARALGVLNLAIASLLAFAIAASTLSVLVFSTHKVPMARPATGPASGPAVEAVEGLAVFGMDDPAFLRFCFVDAATALILDALMFASGLGLLHRRAWGARLWSRTAWAKIVRLVLVWGAYIVAVTPSISGRMAQYIAATNPALARDGSQLAHVTRDFAFLNLVAALLIIGLGLIYPAASIWVLGRPGVRKALDGPETPEGGTA